MSHQNDDLIFTFRDSKEWTGGVYSYASRSIIMSKSFSPSLKVPWIAVFIHELFHAFGIVHTHQRLDRDKYIKVFMTNIKDDYKYQWKKCLKCRIPQDVPYECNSIMHYRQFQAGLRILVFWSDPDPYCQKRVGSCNFYLPKL